MEEFLRQTWSWTRTNILTDEVLRQLYTQAQQFLVTLGGVIIGVAIRYVTSRFGGPYGALPA